MQLALGFEKKSTWGKNNDARRIPVAAKVRPIGTHAASFRLRRRRAQLFASAASSTIASVASPAEAADVYHGIRSGLRPAWGACPDLLQCVRGPRSQLHRHRPRPVPPTARHNNPPAASRTAATRWYLHARIPAGMRPAWSADADLPECLRSWQQRLPHHRPRSMPPLISAAADQIDSSSRITQPYGMRLT